MKYTIGIDFGTLSGRAVLVETATGREIAEAVYDYPHGVMDRQLPSKVPLKADWALQHPWDYMEVYYHTIPQIMEESGVPAQDVIGIGIDFTACTFLPIKADGTPLCLLPEYEKNPHAWVKLWKHHAAQDKASRLNEIALARGEAWIHRYGGKISSEWEVPKVWEILQEAPEIYEAADYFIEAADWAVWALCGKLSRNTCTAGYKGIWLGRDGYPSEDFFAALDLRLRNYVKEKLNYPMAPLGSRVGGLSAKMAARVGLREGIAVAAANVDAHVTVPAVKIENTGAMLAIMGTSTCHMLLAKEEKAVPGICGYADGGIYPGYIGFEAGQSCVGDHFAWFIDQCLPARYHQQARERGLDIHAYLREKAEKLAVGESGLLALDWWNGNRSVLVDVDLSGMLLGMTLQTKPEEIYRALIEATAYGTRRIIDTYRENGVPVNEFYASGGISQKDPMTMQIYADVIGMPVKIAGSRHGPALGSAIFAAVAAGEAAGGHRDIFAAARTMGKLRSEVYTPIPRNQEVYEKLYREYCTLHDYFGRGENNVMKRLKKIKNGVSLQV